MIECEYQIRVIFLCLQEGKICQITDHKGRCVSYEWGGYRTYFDYNGYGQLCILSHEDAGRREKELVKMVYDIGKTWSHKPPGKGME